MYVKNMSSALTMKGKHSQNQHLFPAHTVAADSTLHLIDIKTNIFACCPQGGTIILQMHVVQKLLQTGRTFMVLY